MDEDVRPRRTSGRESARRFEVAGDSMAPFFQPGDSLLASIRARPRSGDVALTIGPGPGGPRLVAHRALLSFGGRLLTKGDFHLIPDGLVPGSAVAGVALAVERPGWGRVDLDCPWARAVSAAAALYGLAAAAAYRAFWFACRAAVLPL